MCVCVCLWYSRKGENSLLWHLFRANSHVLAGHVFCVVDVDTTRFDLVVERNYEREIENFLFFCWTLHICQC